MKHTCYMEEYHLRKPWSEETKKRYMGKKDPKWIIMAIGLVVLAMIVASMTGCKTQYGTVAAVAVPSVHTGSQIQVLKDSFYIDRLHTVTTKGDTVYIHDSIWNTHTKYRHDTISSIDTITLAPQAIEKPLTGTQKFLIGSGMAVWAILVLVILAVIIGIVIKFAK